MSDTVKNCPKCGYVLNKVKSNKDGGLINFYSILCIISAIISLFTFNFLLRTWIEWSKMTAAIGCAILSFIFLILIYRKVKGIYKQLVIPIIAFIYFFFNIYVIFRVVSHDNMREKEYAQYEVEIQTANTTPKNKGLDYIRTNLKNEDIRLIRFKYVDEQKILDEDTPFRDYEGLSLGVFDVSGMSSGNEQVFVFYKKGIPIYMCWGDERFSKYLFVTLNAVWEQPITVDEIYEETLERARKEFRNDPQIKEMIHSW